MKREPKEPPVGIVILSILLFIAAGYSLLQFFGVLVLGSMALPWLASTLVTQAGFSLLFLTLAVSVMQALVLTVLGIGMIKLQSWARILLIVLTGVVLIVRTLVNSFAHGIAYIVEGFIGTGILLILLLYLFTPNVKRAFSANKS